MVVVQRGGLGTAPRAAGSHAEPRAAALSRCSIVAPPLVCPGARAIPSLFQDHRSGRDVPVGVVPHQLSPGTQCVLFCRAVLLLR